MQKKCSNCKNWMNFPEPESLSWLGMCKKAAKNVAEDDGSECKYFENPRTNFYDYLVNKFKTK